MDRIVAIGDTRLNLRVEIRDPAAPWVVFSNSLTTDLSVWDAQAEALRPRFNLLRYDQRGHGASPVAAIDAGFETLGGDLVALLDHVGIERCSLVGLSMGVPTGLAAYRRAAGRFGRLILVDGMARTAPGGAAAWAERLATARDLGMDRYAATITERWLQPDTRDGPLGKRLQAMIAATPFDGLVQSVRALQDYDYTAVVETITCPLLVIAGAEDGTMPETMRRVFGTVPGARIETVAASGHVPNFERPEAFNALVLPFLSADLNG
ncbi:alpha/beta fold hydrolase [Frigidibacter sp.]|uniref:alpha/beta fold hydrolase n=1 Tax=Frigidibacter sp. TaxID=2586418 RepID=UPI002736ED83|nr:alpha/beta fold hydrolase [Frigidibacter sp.]MDP3339315.1 alpha/beta fold hydrolase [Frigidibacter sp.]